MYFHTGNRRLFYNDEGEGPTVVLLHGYLETSEIWNGFANRLAEDFRVITIDLPGHGLSDSFGTSHSMEFMASAIKELLENAGTGRFFLTGHSLGGYVTLAFLDFFPELLTGYCLFHSHPFPDTPEASVKRLKEITLAGEGKKGLFCADNVIRMYADQNLERFATEVERSKYIASGIKAEGIIAVLHGMMERPSRLSVMEEGKVPGLWILGAMDNYIPYDVMRSRVKLPSNAMLVVLENSGHMGFIEEKDLAVRVVREFAANLR
jgi:pimeloyl-ACP methyl ester carboxylesterase